MNIRIVLLLLGLLAGTPGLALERFSYCGELQLAETPAMPMPMASGPLYVGPLGVTPFPPRSCAYVRLGKPVDGHYTPAIVVWSDVPPPMPYHADIYSDAQRIWGHRQGQPSAGDPARNREMEVYLDAAAGTPVLEAVLDALGQGRDTAELERALPVAMPFAGGESLRLKVHYRLFDIRRDAPFPAEVQQLIREARRQHSPHTPQWQAIRIPVRRVPGK